MPKKIQNFARSALVKPITVNVGRAGAASLDVVQEVEYVKQEAKIVHLLETLQKTAPPVRAHLVAPGFFGSLCVEWWLHWPPLGSSRRTRAKAYLILIAFCFLHRSRVCMLILWISLRIL
ncbi:unnamed protein product [Ixodes persulcatus]